ncbi:MAG: NAD(P)/FAD-dependent oxidoreductase [Cylindrospermopsis raciborskii KL1]|jgi:sulfide:quinone oxidoreductase|uniref:NAD(P)/FAD-dependent oxidoreductase n=1 Tax=Cylindrospermopsis raciborskii TaxID=77022 RepID=UPI001A19D2A5|nr:FAD/NAD(P)-binding oxidoreductase [Cylindrospermopsis raciborskii]MBG0742423.1 NAD(P)/FAD-dependent oxidoreductase [Cylindrospermopsis raciborskii KL1]
MAHIVVIGAGLGGLPTAYELRYLLRDQDQVTVISEASAFTFIPSLPWVALGMVTLESIQIDLEPRLRSRKIGWIQSKVEKLDPDKQEVWVGEKIIHYDYLVIAPGAELALNSVRGLGPDQGYTQSVCNPHHAKMANVAWQKLLQQPGPLVVGAVPGASCFGPAYEFALLADQQLRKLGLRDQVPITFVTPEPYAGHLGIGGMANSAQLVMELMEKRNIKVLENTAIVDIQPEQIHLADGQILPFAYSMLLPPFRGGSFLREVPGLTNNQGFMPILPTHQHPDYPSVYSVGVIIELKPPEKTPLPVGVPKTGQMTEAMGMAVAHNIAVELGIISGQLVTPTLEAICFADFGSTGIVFLADPVLPDPKTGRRHRSVAFEGIWVSWMKTAFEKYFLLKMRLGTAVPWFEELALRGIGLSLVRPIPQSCTQ